MAVLRNEGCWDGSNVVLRDGRVVRYEKGRADAAAIGMSHIDYGISVLQRRLVAERLPPAMPQDLGLLYSALADEGRLRGFEVDRRFYEIGSPVGLRDLEAFLGAGEAAEAAP